MSTIDQSRFSDLLPALGTRTARATVSLLGFASAPLRRHLLQTLGGSPGQPGSFLGEPVLEATFGWQPADTTLGGLSGTLLEPTLVDALAAPWSEPEGDAAAYRQPCEQRPYAHQLRAWQALLAQPAQSVVVSSGTGSGKTECFMVPVLNQLAAEARKAAAPLEGVRALFLYPLNALIKSQRERLAAWTGPFQGCIRYCLYNGNTPERVRERDRRAAAHEVQDRQTLRHSPPPILVTNPTMLEYMLVRAQDAPILQKSQGTLRWIVLDEAHNYIGSQAAELALLLRRVLHAFGTRADDVRFVATSATIAGDDDAGRKQLQRFLADLAGVDPSRVVVAEGRRQVPALAQGVEDATRNWGPAELAAGAEGDPHALYQRLSAHPLARELRGRFVPAVSGQNWQKLSAVSEVLQRNDRPSTDADALAWLDLLTSAVHRFGQRDATPFLPLRLHAFHGTLDGLWVCADVGCSCKAQAGPALADPAWPFGMVYTEERAHCECGAPAYPLVSCTDCNEDFLEAEHLHDDHGLRLVAPVDGEDMDEFLLDQEGEDDGQDTLATAGNETDTDTDTEAVDAQQASLAASRTRSLVVHEPWGHPMSVQRGSLELSEQPGAGTVRLRLVVAEEEGDGPGLLRCPCCGADKAHTQQFRRARLGAPFLLGTVIPTLLEFCPDGDKPHESPLRGRRMITFTDSRQGTARIAARLQQDAERTALRAGVYRRLSAESAAEGGLVQPRESLKAEIQQLEEALGGPMAAVLGEGLCAAMRTTLAAKRAELQRLSEGSPVPYRDLMHWLGTVSEDVSHWVHRTYVQSDRIFKDSTGMELLADILLCREFARRPKRQNSLESMGLVTVLYPKLAERIHERKPAVEQAGLSLDEWRGFLKLCLDFFVRQQWCLPLPSAWDRWGALSTHTKQLLSPRHDEDVLAGFVRWPRVRRGGQRQPMLVQLLARALGLNPLHEQGRDAIDALMLAAWDDLVHGAGLLRSGGGKGYYLERADMAFGHLRRGWLCPVTRRILDTTLRGLTPYQPLRVDAPDVPRCQEVEIPVCGLVEGASGDPRRMAKARAWIEAQPAIAQARLDGWWSDLNDRVIEGTGYYRAVEHSAQQSSTRLGLYEDQFRRGLVNLMSCSTTMEMGVDIGGINMVAMNNVPPHPANYLQRAGRAGRRAETRSVALTLCKNNPHDRHVLRHTEWPFATPLPTPRILLSSPVLVQRHVNALLLSTFLKRQDREGRLDKLTNEWWMLPPGDGEALSQQEQFKAWCDNFDEEAQQTTAKGLQALVKCTVFEGAALQALVAEAGEHAKRHADQWRQEVKAIDEQRDALSKKDPDDDLPLRALQLQRKRLTAEYLLRELAGGGFLPGYGFPTDITSFETLNKDSAELARQREQAEGHPEGSREDNRFQRRELPSRDTVTALREYAPGASVVIDGLVYESAGITLNWHVPATADAINEVQNLRHAWRCTHCGASGTHTQLPQQCPECGHALGPRALRRYMEPAGFSVDLYKRTHNDITQQRYVAPEPPWIAGSGRWMPLSNPALGRFRSGSEGSVLHHSAGPGGRGYALCLECGRAAPMSDSSKSDAIPRVLKEPHPRLRGRRGREERGEMCGGGSNGQEFKIQRSLSFGREYTTDVLELSLNGVDGRPLRDKVVAFTLAVALRRAIARHLGIDEGELGCDTKDLRDEAGQRSRVIQVFDMRAAGYCTLAAPELPELLRAVHGKYLGCGAGCDGACQRCLLGYDTRFRADDLDRRRALEFLTQQWVDALALPEAQRLLGPDSRAEAQPLDEALMHALNRGGARRLMLYLHGAPAQWDLQGSPLRRLARRLADKAADGGPARLCLVAAQPDLTTLAPADADTLQRLQQDHGVDLLAGGPPPLHRPGAVLATVELADGRWRSWATAEAELAQPDVYWGRPGAQALVSAETSGPELSAQAPRLPEATPAADSGRGRTLEITNQLDTGLDAAARRVGQKEKSFGQRFWTLLGDGDIARALPEDKRVAAVSYEDRYLNTPISCALLVDVISALKEHYEPLDGWDAPRVEVATMYIDKAPRGAGSGSASAWTADWPDSAQRDAALREAFAYAGIDAQVLSAGKRDLMHGRRLIVSFDDGTRLSIVPDQGWAYWTLDRSPDARLAPGFALGAAPAVLAQVLGDFRADVRGHKLPTLVAVDWS